MPIITCKKCGAKVSNEFSYCTNCGNSLRAKLEAKLERKTPSETRQGAVVGGFVGLLYGIVTAVQFYFIMFPVMMPIIIKQLMSDPRFTSNPLLAAQFPSLLSTIMSVAMVVVVLMIALFSCVLGVLFVKFRQHIPGSSIIRKSMVFPFILMAISFILTLRSLLDPRAIAMFGTSLFPLQIESSELALVEYLLFGWLFGYLLERRLKPKGI